MRISDIHGNILAAFRDGVVIPAMPLALKEDRSWDQQHQRALLRYYIDAGAGGIAVAVHSTQFEIRDKAYGGLFAEVLAFASICIDEWCRRRNRAIFKIAGVCGQTPQALAEAEIARDRGYHACLLSLAALRDESAENILAHCRRVAAEMPIIGFYLQPAVGGAILPYAFWRRFVEIDNVLAIKVAPFNRYRTLDVVRALADSGRHTEVSLYTGNDDAIVVDLLTKFRVRTAAGDTEIRFAGGLLGHWGFWTQQAVCLLERLKKLRCADLLPADILTLAAEVTDVNAAVFDAAHDFRGCIPGIHEMLRRQGLLAGVWCLRPDEVLSPGQAGEIDRVIRSYPHLSDEDFTRRHVAEWLAD